MHNDLEDKFGLDRKEVSEIRSEAVFRLGVVAEVDGSSNLFHSSEGLSQRVASNDFQCLKIFHFLAAVFVEGAGGN